MTAASRAGWLTIEQVCADLQVPESEWLEWRAAGNTPLHVATPDGQLRVRAADYARWLDSIADDVPAEQAREDADTGPLRPLSRQALSDASRPAGADASRSAVAEREDHR